LNIENESAKQKLIQNLQEQTIKKVEPYVSKEEFSGLQEFIKLDFASQEKVFLEVHLPRLIDEHRDMMIVIARQNKEIKRLRNRCEAYQLFIDMRKKMKNVHSLEEAERIGKDTDNKIAILLGQIPNAA